MSGKHAHDGSARQVLPAVIALVVVAILVGAGTLALWIGAPPPSRTQASWTDVPVDAAPSVSPSPAAPAAVQEPPPVVAAPSPAASDSRPSARADRAGARSSASPKRSAAPSEPAGVSSSGTCGASYYDTGSVTANGESFDPDGITAAHKTLAFGTRVKVTNPGNGKSVTVRINDRGPFISGRCLDLSRGAFRQIASLGAGVLTVRYEVLN